MAGVVLEGVELQCESDRKVVAEVGAAAEVSAPVVFHVYLGGQTVLLAVLSTQWEETSQETTKTSQLMRKIAADCLVSYHGRARPTPQVRRT